MSDPGDDFAGDFGDNDGNFDEDLAAFERKCAAKAGKAGYDDGNDYAEESDEEEAPVVC
jgi:hypothetical protein